MTTRRLVLGRIRAALADVPAEERPQDVPVPRDYRRSHAEGDLTALFAERVADYRAVVTRCAPADVAATIRLRLADRRRGAGPGRVLVPEGFPEAIHPDPSRASCTDDPGAADSVVTTVAVAVAVTGTVVLDAGPGQGRRVQTLLPDHHLCVVRSSQILADLPEALAALDPSRPLTFISGPSATSDIELDRVEGVHGPRLLDVLIVEDLA